MVFTPNKNLEQPARGSNVGVWDTPVNSNTGIIDNSFGGVATIPLVNTPVTLSAAQYQCVFLNFTGAISANIPITLPAVGSYYTVQNLTSNTSAFGLTMLTTAAGGQTIGIPPGEPIEIFTDGTNVKYRNLGRIGTYWDYAGSSVPAWVSACTVPPYLNCNGAAFSSATYPILATILGGTTLPDSQGRLRATLNQGTARITSGSSTGGVDGNTILSAGGAQTITLSSQNLPPVPIAQTAHSHDVNVTTSGANTSQFSGTIFANAGANVGRTIDAPNTTMRSTTIGDTTITITAGNASPTNYSNLPPLYIGGLTLNRAA